MSHWSLVPCVLELLFSPGLNGLYLEQWIPRAVVLAAFTIFWPIHGLIIGLKLFQGSWRRNAGGLFRFFSRQKGNKASS